MKPHSREDLLFLSRCCYFLISLGLISVDWWHLFTFVQCFSTMTVFPDCSLCFSFFKVFFFITPPYVGVLTVLYSLWVTSTTVYFSPSGLLHWGLLLTLLRPRFEYWKGTIAPKLLFPFLHNFEAPGSLGTHKNAANPIHSSHVHREFNADFTVLCIRIEYTTNKDCPQECELSRKNPGGGTGTEDSWRLSMFYSGRMGGRMGCHWTYSLVLIDTSFSTRKPQ